MVTGLAVVDAGSKRYVLGHETTEVTFRRLTRAELLVMLPVGSLWTRLAPMASSRELAR